MSGSVDFIKTDPFQSAFGIAQDQRRKTEEDRRKQDVDAAIRRGLQNGLNAPGATPYQAPAPAAPPPTDPTAAAPPGMMPPDQPPPSSDDLTNITMNRESGGNPTVVNKGGYAGLFQMGKKAMLDAGAYQPAANEDMNDNLHWAGTITPQGMAPMSQADWLNNPSAQMQTFQQHQGNLTRQITSLGLDKYIGQTIGGVPISQTSLLAMMHGGGPQGTKTFLETGGSHNPADGNGTSLAQFGMRGAGVQPGAPPGVPPNGRPGTDGYNVPAVPMGMAGPAGASQSNLYAPILSELANVPGGGTAALGLLQHNANARLDQQRQLGYQRLAMAALARGDMPTAQYYMTQGGVDPNTARQLMSAQNPAMLGKYGKLAQEIYGVGTPGAHAFFQEMTQNGGNAQLAAQKAGVPQDKYGQQLHFFTGGDGQTSAYWANSRDPNAPVTPVKMPDAPGGGPGGPALKPPTVGAGGGKIIKSTDDNGVETWYQVQPNGTAIQVNVGAGAGATPPPPAADGTTPPPAAPRPLTGQGATPAAVKTRNAQVSALRSIGYSNEDAVGIANGGVPKPATVSSAYTKIMASVDLVAFGQTEAAKAALVETGMRNAFGPNWRKWLSGAVMDPAADTTPYKAPAPAPANAPAALPPAATDAPTDPLGIR